MYTVPGTEWTSSDYDCTSFLFSHLYLGASFLSKFWTGFPEQHFCVLIVVHAGTAFTVVKPETPLTSFHQPQKPTSGFGSIGAHRLNFPQSFSLGTLTSLSYSHKKYCMPLKISVALWFASHGATLDWVCVKSSFATGRMSTQWFPSLASDCLKLILKFPTKSRFFFLLPLPFCLISSLINSFKSMPFKLDFHLVDDLLNQSIERVQELQPLHFQSFVKPRKGHFSHQNQKEQAHGKQVKSLDLTFPDVIHADNC